MLVEHKKENNQIAYIKMKLISKVFFQFILLRNKIHSLNYPTIVGDWSEAFTSNKPFSKGEKLI